MNRKVQILAGVMLAVTGIALAAGVVAGAVPEIVHGAVPLALTVLGCELARNGIARRK
jgi:hypothetical protein